jgi:hypothetical protein
MCKITDVVYEGYEEAWAAYGYMHSVRSFWSCTDGRTIYCDTLHLVFYTYGIVIKHNMTT